MLLVAIGAVTIIVLVVIIRKCALSKAQYAQHAARFQALDASPDRSTTSRRKPSLTQAEQLQLGDLARQYIELAGKLGQQ